TRRGTRAAASTTSGQPGTLGTVRRYTNSAGAPSASRSCSSSRRCLTKDTVLGVGQPGRLHASLRRRRNCKSRSTTRALPPPCLLALCGSEPRSRGTRKILVVPRVLHHEQPPPGGPRRAFVHVRASVARAS